MNRKLFVGNIPFQTSEDDLQTLFGQAGPVESVRVMRDNATGRARGFAFVEMQTEDGASAAIERFNQYQLGGLYAGSERGATDDAATRRRPVRRWRWWRARLGSRPFGTALVVLRSSGPQVLRSWGP